MALSTAEDLKVPAGVCSDLLGELRKCPSTARSMQSCSDAAGDGVDRGNSALLAVWLWWQRWVYGVLEASKVGSIFLGHPTLLCW